MQPSRASSPTHTSNPLGEASDEKARRKQARIRDLLRLIASHHLCVWQGALHSLTMAMRVVNARARAPSMFSQGSPRASFLGAPQTRALSTARNVSQTHQACETTRRSASATRSAVGASAFFPTARPLHASALGARRSFSSARELRETAWAMVRVWATRAKAFSCHSPRQRQPLDSPSYPQSSFVYREREFLSITYRTDRRSLEAVVPAPLEIPDDNLVR